MAEETAAGYLDGRIDALREHVASLAAAVPALPAQFARVGDQLAQDWQARPPGYVAGLIFGFLLLGFAIEALYRRWVAVPQSRMAAGSARARSGCDSPASSAPSPPSPSAARRSSSPSTGRRARARRWSPSSPRSSHCARSSSQAARCSRRATRGCASFLRATARRVLAPARRAFAGWFAFGWVVINWLALLGMDLASRQIVAYVLGLGLLAIAIEAFWRRTRLSAPYFVLLWLLWAAQAWGIFWLAVMAGRCPRRCAWRRRLPQHAQRHPGRRGRAGRAALIIGAAFLLVRAFGLDVDALAAGDTFWTRLLRGAVHAWRSCWWPTWCG